MPAKRARRRRHEVRETGAAQRRHRILATSRSLEDIPASIDRAVDIACSAGHTDLKFDFVVIRLEFLVSERPVLDGTTRRYPCRAVTSRSSRSVP